MKTPVPFRYQKIKPEGKWLEARVAVNQYLLFKIGSAFMAGEPEMVEVRKLVLRVPVIYTGRDKNYEVGSFYVRADTNEVLIKRCDSKEQIYAAAGIGEEAALSAEG